MDLKARWGHKVPKVRRVIQVVRKVRPDPKAMMARKVQPDRPEQMAQWDPRGRKVILVARKVRPGRKATTAPKAHKEVRAK